MYNLLYLRIYPLDCNGLCYYLLVSKQKFCLHCYGRYTFSYISFFHLVSLLPCFLLGTYLILLLLCLILYFADRASTLLESTRLVWRFQETVRSLWTGEGAFIWSFTWWVINCTGESIIYKVKSYFNDCQRVST